MSKKASSVDEKPTVGYILCYSMPNYVRTEVLLAMLEDRSIPVHTAINTSRGRLRYLQTLWRLLVMRLRYNPDVYLLGFRGQEIYWPVRLLTIGKPLVFDEFLNMYLWIIEEHKLVKRSNPIAWLIRVYVWLSLRASQKVLSDTSSHAAYSAALSGLPNSKFLPLYVGTNEALFTERNTTQSEFTVFYYGSKFLPLHGVDIVAEAFALLKDIPAKLVIIGGGEKSKTTARFMQKVSELQLEQVVTHKARVPYEELVEYAAKADLCLGGPFGKTPQSEVVVTGKTFQFLAMAKPVVIGENAETTKAGFKDSENCLLVQRGDAEDLARVIRWAYNNQQKLPTIGKAGRELYDQVFSVSVQAPKLERMLRELR